MREDGNDVRFFAHNGLNSDITPCPFRAKTGSDKPYSITSSARARRDAGTSRPSDFAILRMMTSAYLEGCSIVLLENTWAWKTSTWLTWRKARFSSSRVHSCTA